MKKNADREVQPDGQLVNVEELLDKADRVAEADPIRYTNEEVFRRARARVKMAKKRIAARQGIP